MISILIVLSFTKNKILLSLDEKNFFNSWTKLYIYIYIVGSSWPTVVDCDPKAPFSIASTPRCCGGYYSFSWFAPLTLNLYHKMMC